MRYCAKDRFHACLHRRGHTKKPNAMTIPLPKSSLRFLLGPLCFLLCISCQNDVTDANTRSTQPIADPPWQKSTTLSHCDVGVEWRACLYPYLGVQNTNATGFCGNFLIYAIPEFCGSNVTSAPEFLQHIIPVDCTVDAGGMWLPCTLSATDFVFLCWWPSGMHSWIVCVTQGEMSGYAPPPVWQVRYYFSDSIKCVLGKERDEYYVLPTQQRNLRIGFNNAGFVVPDWGGVIGQIELEWDPLDRAFRVVTNDGAFATGGLRQPFLPQRQ